MTEETTETIEVEEPQEKPVYGNVSIEELEKPEYDEDQVNEFMALYEESISGIKEGQIVKGTVAATGPSEVMVDIGFKSEGAVSIKEFSDPEAIEIGQEIEVFLEMFGGFVHLAEEVFKFLAYRRQVSADEGGAIKHVISEFFPHVFRIRLHFLTSLYQSLLQVRLTSRLAHHGSTCRAAGRA